MDMENIDSKVLVRGECESVAQGLSTVRRHFRKGLIHLGVNVNGRLASNQWTPLEWLIHQGYEQEMLKSDEFLGCLSSLLHAGAMPSPNGGGWSALVDKVCERTAHASLTLLLKCQQFTNDQILWHHRDPLMVLCIASESLTEDVFLQSLELLLKAGYRPTWNRVIFHYLCRNGASGAIDILCRYQINFSDHDEGYMEMALKHDDTATLEVLAAHGARFKSTVMAMQTVTFLLNALSSGSTSALNKVRICLQAGLDPNWGAEYGQSFIHRFVKSTGRDLPPDGVLPLLLEHGAWINLPTKDGTTPLMLACQALNHHMLAELLRHGADLHARDNAGRTCFFYSLKNSIYAPAFWRLLVDAGVDVEARCNLSRTALHYATLHLGLRRFQSFLDLNVDTKATDRNGWTVLHYASYASRLSTLSVLLDAELLDVNARDNKGRTPLHVFGLKDYAPREHLDFGSFVDLVLEGIAPRLEPKSSGNDSVLSNHSLRKLLTNGADPLIADSNGNLPFAAIGIMVGPDNFNQLFMTVQFAALRGLSSLVLRN